MLGSTNLFSSGCAVPGHILVGGKISWAAGDQSASSILYIFRRCTHLQTNVYAMVVVGFSHLSPAQADRPEVGI